MLPATYQIPAALVLLLGGIVSCLFGYRLFRIVLAIFGFVIGALIPSSFLPMSSSPWAMLAVALVGGLMGAGVLIAAYFVGVALVGAGLGAVAANLMFSATGQDPHYLVLVLMTLLGAAAAMYLQRYFIIVGTAFGGAWTLIVGAAALFGDSTALAAAAANDVWVAYPLNPAPGRGWVKLAWIVLGLIGATVQLGWTGGERGRVVRRKKKS
jgi:hypothetical protein